MRKPRRISEIIKQFCIFGTVNNDCHKTHAHILRFVLDRNLDFIYTARRVRTRRRVSVRGQMLRKTDWETSKLGFNARARRGS